MNIIAEVVKAEQKFLNTGASMSSNEQGFGKYNILAIEHLTLALENIRNLNDLIDKNYIERVKLEKSMFNKLKLNNIIDNIDENSNVEFFLSANPQDGVAVFPINASEKSINEAMEEAFLQAARREKLLTSIEKRVSDLVNYGLNYQVSIEEEILSIQSELSEFFTFRTGYVVGDAYYPMNSVAVVCTKEDGSGYIDSVSIKFEKFLINKHLETCVKSIEESGFDVKKVSQNRKIG